jgi:hypothetical protein
VPSLHNFHPEAKCADTLGNPCERQTIGLLQRRHIKVDLIKCIGKESNSLENVDEGMVHPDQNVYTGYADPRRSEWITKFQPALKKPAQAPVSNALKGIPVRPRTVSIIRQTADRLSS